MTKAKRERGMDRAIEQYSLIEISKPFIDELAVEVGERVELNSLGDWRQGVLYVADGKRDYSFH